VKHPLVVASLVTVFVVPLAGPAGAQPTPPQVSYDEALRAARRAAPDLVVARAREGVALAEVGVAGVYPNPSVAVGTSTQTAKLSGTLSLPLVILGQRGAAIDAAKAEQTTVLIDTQVAWNDVRQAAARAFVTLWLAQGIAEARRESAAIQGGLEAAVVSRVQVGSAPEIDSLRVHAEKLRADADVIGATAEVTAAGTELGRWMGMVDGAPVAARGDVASPDAPPSLATLAARIDGGAPVRRERSDVAAAEARADHERALVRPWMGLDLGFDAFDPTLCATPNSGCNPPVNYRAQLSIEIPIFNQRGPFIDREKALADVARARVQAAHIQQTAELTAAYRTFEAATARQKTLSDAVVPAARSAAKSTEEAYALGRAQLVAVLDAERTLIDVRLSALEAQAARANAWIEVEHAVGAP
jgi:cobalt-zinc-cadmium efflux system outer membrane protein